MQNVAEVSKDIHTLLAQVISNESLDNVKSCPGGAGLEAQQTAHKMV